MEAIIKIDNLKCGGCASSIKAGLKSFSGVKEANVDKEKEEVHVKYTADVTLEAIKTKLKNMGYPEKDSTQGFEKFSANAKSYISCAIGKFNKEDNDE
jgi:copper chaperone